MRHTFGLEAEDHHICDCSLCEFHRKQETRSRGRGWGDSSLAVLEKNKWPVDKRPRIQTQADEEQLLLLQLMLRAAAGSPKLRTTETLESLLRLFDVSRLHGLDDSRRELGTLIRSCLLLEWFQRPTACGTQEHREQMTHQQINLNGAKVISRKFRVALVDQMFDAVDVDDEYDHDDVEIADE